MGRLALPSLALAVALLVIPWPTRAEGPACPAGMAALPGGAFQSAYKQKKQVTVAPFCLDVTEVTVDQWAACEVGSSRVDLQACKLEYSIVSPK